MKSNPVLSRFRRDNAAKLHAAKIMSNVDSDWRVLPYAASVVGDLGRFASGAELSQCPAAAALVSDRETARKFVDEWIARYCRALELAPLGQPGFQYQSNASASVAMLARDGQAELSLVCYSGLDVDARAEPDSGYFAPTERHEIILSGSGILQTASRREVVSGPDDFIFASREVGPGSTLSQYGPTETKAFTRIDGCLTLLRLTRPSANPGPTREYRYSDGALLHQASSDKHESCKEMMVALLGEMGRNDAVPAIARLASEGSGHLRWQALRQCLSLDTARGFEILCSMAISPDDPLAPPAGALRAQLIESYPQLAELEKSPCLL